MIRYIIKRLLLTILVVVGAAVIIFTVMYFVPGDPVDAILDADATPEAIAAVRAQLGLDQPFFTQLGNFLFNAFIRFDLGNSWVRGTSVVAGVMDRLPRTFLLGILTVLIICVFGIPLGVTAAIRRGKWQDRGLILASMVFISVPEFWLALMLIIVFALKLNVVPAFGITTWTCYVLPVVSGGVSGICNVARQTRASVLECVNADYVVTARAKGMKERLVTYKHMLPNALIPVITIAGNYFARCVGGTIVIEKIFSFPGLGMYLTDAISSRDYPIIRGCVIIMAAFTALIMLLIDLAYAFVNPQIRAQYAASSKRKGNRRSLLGGHHGGRRGHGGHHGGQGSGWSTWTQDEPEYEGSGAGSPAADLEEPEAAPEQGGGAS